MEKHINIYVYIYIYNILMFHFVYTFIRMYIVHIYIYIYIYCGRSAKPSETLSAHPSEILPNKSAHPHAPKERAGEGIKDT